MNALICNSRVIAVNVRDDGGIRDDNCIYAWATLADVLDCPDGTVVGMTYRDGSFVLLGEVPESVTALQALLAIDTVAGLSGAYEALANDPARSFAERAFINKAQTWKRNDQTLQAAATALGISDSQVDDLFRLAATL